MWRWVALVGIVAASLVGCRSEPAFLGTWKESGNTGETLTFNRDQSVIIGNGRAGTFSGKWEAEGGDVLTVQFADAARNERLKTRWRVSDDGKTLALSPVEGESSLPAATYTR